MNYESARRRRVAAALALAPLALAGRRADAQAFAGRTVRLLVGYAPGAHSDTIARLIGRQLGDQLKVPVVVENLSGANGTLALSALAVAPPDGATIGLVASGNLLLAPLLDGNVRYDAQRDFAALARISRAPMVLAARADLPARNVAELLDYAARNPGRLTYASTGNVARMAIEALKASAGIDVLVVPYRGTSPALLDVIAGRVDLLLVDVASAAPHVRSGALRLLASADPVRAPAFPDLPTMVQQGVADFVWEAWQGIAAPAGTPAAVVGPLRAALLRARGSAEFRGGLEKLGFEPIDEPAEAFEAVIRAEGERLRRVVARLGPAAFR
jgi:tripartite-type tricarboxylate transporter receptor subunit TctC